MRKQRIGIWKNMRKRTILPIRRTRISMCPNIFLVQSTVRRKPCRSGSQNKRRRFRRRSTMRRKQLMKCWKVSPRWWDWKRTSRNIAHGRKSMRIWALRWRRIHAQQRNSGRMVLRCAKTQTGHLSHLRIMRKNRQKCRRNSSLWHFGRWQMHLWKQRTLLWLGKAA